MYNAVIREKFTAYLMIVQSVLVVNGTHYNCNYFVTIHEKSVFPLKLMCHVRFSKVNPQIGLFLIHCGAGFILVAQLDFEPFGAF